jgi:DNA polymerase V
MSVPEHALGSRTSAGFPSPADDYLDKALDLNALLIKNRVATFFMRVDGNALEASGIKHDDMLIVDRSITAAPGKIVVAVVVGDLVVRKVEMHSEKMVLTADDPSTAIVLDGQDIQIWGVVTSVVHQF